jgi:hypothetical protein
MKVGDLVQHIYDADYGYGMIAREEVKTYNHGSYIQVWWTQLGFFQWRRPKDLEVISESR